MLNSYKKYSHPTILIFFQVIHKMRLFVFKFYSETIEDK